MIRTAVVLAVAALVGVGCAADVEAPSYNAGLFPKTAYSGFGGDATFRVLFATSGRNPQWTVADPTMATIAPSPPPAGLPKSSRNLAFAMVTTLKPGETTVTAAVEGRALTANLVIKAYSPEQITLGRARYENADADPARPPCAQCHRQADGVDHSPLKMAGFDDGVILGVIQEGTYPPTPKGQSTTSEFAPSGPLKTPFPHKWNLTDPEKDAVLSHLRSLPLGGI